MRKTLSSLLILVSITTVAVLGADLRLGTWKFVAAKSKSTATNPIKTQTDIREALPDGRVQVTRSGTYADGSVFKYVYAFKYDGKEYKVKGAPFDLIAVKRIDMYTTSFEASAEPGKAGNKYNMRGQTVVSRDAQTLTQTSHGTDASGKAVESTADFVRQ